MSVKFLGNTDDVTACDCCGRSDLKSTVALSIDGGEPVYYGVVCAARALNSNATEVRRQSRKADDERAAAEEARLGAERDAEFARWCAFLAARGTGRDVFTRIQSLGGYLKARALYRSERGKDA